MTQNWYKLLDRQSRLGFWTSFAGFALDAMDVQLYAFIMPALIVLWRMSNEQAGLLVTITLGCGALGGWVAGRLADRFGRVCLLKISILWLAVSTCLCAVAQNYDQLLVARALQGIGFGAEWAVGAVFVAEIASPEARARMVGTAQSAWPVGWALAAINGTLALSFLPEPIGWRASFFVGLVPALFIFGYRRELCEPATFLNRQRADPWYAIFSAKLLPSTFRGSLLATGMHGGYWAIATWWPIMLQKERGFAMSTSSLYFGALVSGSFVGYAAGARLGDRVGRRATLMLFAVGAIALVLACTVLKLPDLALLVLSVPLGFFALGMFSLISSILAELYPTELRGSGLGFCYNIGRGIAGMTPFLVGSALLKAHISESIGVVASGAFAIVLLAAFLLPETRGRDFTENLAAA